jgi:L-lactate permease
MRRRTRKLVGTFAMVAFVVVYALIVMALAQTPLLQNAAAWAQGIFYVVGGLGWIVPIMPLIRWMEGGGD